MVEYKIQQEIKSEKYKRSGNYVGAIISGAGGVVGIASMLIPILSNPEMKIQYGNQDYTTAVFLAGMIAFISSSVGLCKSLNGAAENNKVINNLEKILIRRENGIVK